MTASNRSTKFGISVFTLIEVGAVSALLLVQTWLMLAVVLVAFFAEHVASFNTKRPERSLFTLSGLPIENLAIVAAFEAATWIVWIRLASDRPFVAAAVLAGGLLVGHVLERNVGAGLDLFEDVGRRVRESLDFTALETATGIGWLLLLDVHGLLAVAALALGLYVEHRISLRRPVGGA